MSDDKSDWPENDTATFQGSCEWCNEPRLLQKVNDPFAAEGIIDEDPNEEFWLCYECWHTRVGDV